MFYTVYNWQNEAIKKDLKIECNIITNIELINLSELSGNHYNYYYNHMILGHSSLLIKTIYDELIQASLKNFFG